MSSDRIILEDMIFFGYHGTRPEENTLGQRFVVDVALHLDLRAAGEADDLAATVDYSAVHARARAIVEGPPLRLTEAVAERIAAAVLAEHPAVEAVEVRVRKPSVRLDDTVLAGSVVQILRRR
ncbi:MAG TPA: dihydroneopterin aldolase [Chloroflexaceae bacterium]|nr:dihydroneopterin aldolase [Chloroflexaceae bacterium]